MAWIEPVVRYALIGAGLLILIALYIFLMVRAYRALEVKADRSHSIKLTNQGNVRSVFRLMVESSEPRLSFKFVHNGLPLIVVTDEPVPETPETNQFTENQQGALQRKPPSGHPLADINKAAQTGQNAAAKVGALASLLGALGSLLPGSLGNQLRTKGAGIRGMQTRTIQATQKPLSVQRKVEGFKLESGRLAGDSSGGEALHINDQPAHRVSTGKALIVNSSPQKSKRGHHHGSYCVQTIEVDPGESLALTLKIGAQKRRYPEGSFLYTIQSRQVPVAAADPGLSPVTTRGIIHFKPIPLWRYWLPILFSGILVGLTFLSIFYYLTVIS